MSAPSALALDAAAPRARTRLWVLTSALAWRDLRGGLGDFTVFIACVALGVFVITAVSALGDALTLGLAKQGAMILGGDVTLTRTHTPVLPETRRWLETQGQLSETATMRTMARRIDGTDQTLAEVKGVDAAYPLKGAVVLEPGVAPDSVAPDSVPLATALARPLSAAVEAILLERLDLHVGDKLALGRAEVTIAGVIRSEPDGLLDRAALGPRILVSLATLSDTQLVQPGALVRWRYALALDGSAGTAADANDTGLIATRAALASRLPEQGFTVLDRRDPSPQMRRTIERLRQFLTLIGLTALVVGGVGIANAVAAYVDKRRNAIAVMKSLGASSGLIERLYLTQILGMAGIGIALGLGLGLAVPAAVSALWGANLPIAPVFSPSLRTALSGAAYGLLVTLLFAIAPLSRARAVSPAVLFRDGVAPEQRVFSRPTLLALGIVAASLVAVTILSADNRSLALEFSAGLVVSFLLFTGLGRLVARLARRVPRPRPVTLALALHSLRAPDGLGPTVVLSLGVGLSLLVAVALTDAALVKELTGRLPAATPTYFVLDVAKADYAGLAARIEELAAGSRLEQAPMLRGRLVALNGEPVEKIRAPSEAEWVLSGDRGLTYSDVVPAGSNLVAGAWWTREEDKSGGPLVSFESDLARRLGLRIGDTITVNVLGRDVTARVHNLREVNWESLAINFVMVFSPSTLKSAPHNLLVTIAMPTASGLKEEASVARAISQAFPTMTVIRVRDALNGFAAVLGKVMVAVRAAGGVTLLAGALVLAGGLATAERKRAGEAVILKTLGLTRRRIILAHMIEYAALSLVSGGLAVIVGGVYAWLATTHVMHIPFVLAWPEALEALGAALVLVAGLGALSTWRVLSVRAAPYLRSQ